LGLKLADSYGNGPSQYIRDAATDERAIER